MCIDIVEIWYGTAHWEILSIFDRVICLRHDNGGVLSFHVFIVCFNVLLSYSEKPWVILDFRMRIFSYIGIQMRNCNPRKYWDNFCYLSKKTHIVGTH